MTAVIVSLENPLQDALQANSAGDVTYAGTQATLYQDMLHEIGHAIGLGDNDNPNSIMSYYLNGANQNLSAADIAAAQQLYAPASNAMMANVTDLAASPTNASTTTNLLAAALTTHAA